MCVILIGPDGSGKSTLAVMLANELNLKVVWMRGTHLFASVLAVFLSKFKAFQGGRQSLL